MFYIAVDFAFLKIFCDWLTFSGNILSAFNLPIIGKPRFHFWLTYFILQKDTGNLRHSIASRKVHSFTIFKKYLISVIMRWINLEHSSYIKNMFFSYSLFFIWVFSKFSLLSLKFITKCDVKLIFKRSFWKFFFNCLVNCLGVKVF